MNPTDTLAAHRPTDDDLLTAWPASDRYAVWSSLKGRLASDLAPVERRGSLQNPAHRRLRRWVIAGAAASAVAVALSMGPALLGPDGNASAQAVSQLVTSAKLSTAVVIPEGKVLHLRVEDDQHSTSPSTNTGRRTLESWIATDGHTWRRDVENNGDVQYYLFAPRWSGDGIDRSPAGVASLPSESSTLLALLDGKVTGANSHHEAIFFAVGDLVRLGYVTPAVRAAAIEAAAGLPEVTAVRESGRTTLSFSDDSMRKGVVQSLVFDSATAALLAERTTATQDDFVYNSTTTIQAIVDAVPTEVIERAQPSG